MKLRLKLIELIFVAIFTFNFMIGNAQNLFKTDSIQEFTLAGNTKKLSNNREGVPKDFNISLLYKNADTTAVIPIIAKTRGNFRRLKSNCFFPPLSLNFKQAPTKNSPFEKLGKLKLVMPCKDDEFVVREWLVYKLYNLITPKSFAAKLVKVKLYDSSAGKISEPFYGILLEEEKQMAARNNYITTEKRLKPSQVETDAFLITSVFEYMIGNTDWSVEYLQNIKLISPDSNAVPTAIPYDFDHSGIVNAPYAQPTPELLLSSVRQRRYRGYCITDMAVFENAINLFNNQKINIYNLYLNCNLINEKYKTATIKYLDEFYATLNNPLAFKKEFGYPCDKNGTANVIIKGLKNNIEDE